MFSRIITTTAFAALYVAAIGCGEDDAPTADPSLIQFVDATATDCPAGGKLVQAGVDADGNGVLEGAEVATSVPVCTGAEGAAGGSGIPGTGALIRTTDEAAGDNCAAGGLKIDVGSDADGDGTLSEPEVAQTTYACDGIQGPTGLSTVSRTSLDTAGGCESGIRVEYGLDLNGNGDLDDDEVTTTRDVCDGEAGLTSLVDIFPEPPGANCTQGGLRFLSGIDLDGSLTLDEAEVLDESFVCNAVQSLVRVTAELAGTSTTCVGGGSRVETGPDLDGDGVLDEEEVLDNVLTCSGADGLRALVVTDVEPVGANCAAGGRRVDSGVDLDGDAQLSSSEITSTTYVCNGEQGADGAGGNAFLVGAEPPGANCAVGGLAVSTGPDTNGNGTLDPSEITNTQYVCDGVSTTNLVAVRSEPAGATCSAGGQRVEIGTDANGNGQLDASEVTTTRVVCNSTSTGVPFAIVTAALPSAFTGQFFDQEITALGGAGGAFTWEVISGALPPGFLLEDGTPSARLTGSSTVAATYTFTIEVEDFFGTTASRAYTLEIEPAPCTPGVGGLAGTTETSVSHTAATTSASQGMAADGSLTGYVYFTSANSWLVRAAKDGLTADNVLTLASGSGLVSADLGNEVDIEGDNIYIASDTITCSTTVDCVFRISSNGGATFERQSVATFSPSTNDDIRGIAQDGNTLFMITHDAAETQVWSVDLTQTLPAPATLLATLSNYDYCSGLDYDDDFLYTGCDDSTTGDAIIRIDRATLATGTPIVEEVYNSSTVLRMSTSGQNGIAVQDGDGDGLADVVWFNGDNNNSSAFGSTYVCDPGTTTAPFVGSFGITISQDEGLAFDPALNAVWLHNESSTMYRYD